MAYCTKLKIAGRNVAIASNCHHNCVFVDISFVAMSYGSDTLSVLAFLRLLYVGMRTWEEGYEWAHSL